ncbi:MAG: hypothetical protein OXI79_00325 [Gammaproteobacteria bacterium]|nr:hypothetical protein [Gammaproteobacteria bacterium]
MAGVSNALGAKFSWRVVIVATMAFVVGYQLTEVVARGVFGLGVLAVALSAVGGAFFSALALRWQSKIGGVAVGVGSFVLLLNVAAWVVLEFGWATSVGTGWQTACVALALVVAVVIAVLFSARNGIRKEPGLG